MSQAAIHIGTSGWNYRHWKDNVYRGRRQREWLPYLARFFNAIEINTSFYRIPSESAIHDWQQATPSQLQFAVKMWRGITHYRKLANCEDLATPSATREVFVRCSPARQGRGFMARAEPCASLPVRVMPGSRRRRAAGIP
jgi:uncharacterized protein YecE (DUF72 family)